MRDWQQFVRGKLDAPGDVIDEIASQLEDAYDDARRAGLSDEEAVERAAGEVPDWDAFREAVVQARRPPIASRTWKRTWNADFVQDLRYAMRNLVAHPGSTALACAALALGIGANTVSFTFVHSMLFDTIPAHEPERLVRIYGSIPGSFDYATISFPDYLDIDERTSLFDGLLVDKLVPLNFGAGGDNQRVWGYIASGDYFSVLGVAPALGRVFAYDDVGADGKFPVVVLSHGFWQRAFGGSPDAVGRIVHLNGHPFEVIGVAPESFGGTGVGIAAELWAPTSMSEAIMPGFDKSNRDNRSFLSVARLAPGVSLDEAREGLELLARQLELEYPGSYAGSTFRVLPEAEGGIHPIMRSGVVGFSGVLVGVVALVLLLACANVAGLLLARAAYRRREIGLRVALGATRGRLIRQLLTESVLLAALAGACGVVTSLAAIRVLGGARPPVDVPIYLPMAIDDTVLGFALVATALTGIVFGLVPALQTSRADVVSSLKASLGGASAARLRGALVAAQVALSTLLLVGAGLFVKSLQNAHRIDIGFEPEGVAIASVDLSLQGYDEDRAWRFFEEIETRVRAVPGVASVAWAHMIPFDIDINQSSIAPEGWEPPEGAGIPSISRNVVSHGYFETMRTRIVAGRDFTAFDDVDAPPVAIINETLAERFWPGESPIGKRMGRNAENLMEVVGVVEDGKYLTLGEAPTPVYFYAHAQRRSMDMTLVVRSRGALPELLDTLRMEVHRLDANLPVYDAKPLTEHIDIAVVPARVGASLLGSFGAVALVLASIGLYGMLAFAVAQQSYEIGIRRALGAQDRSILAAVVRRGLVWTGLGAALGLAASLVAGRALVSVLYGIDPADPGTIASAVAALALAALLACWIPARRAMRVDPIVALRAE